MAIFTHERPTLARRVTEEHVTTAFLSNVDDIWWFRNGAADSFKGGGDREIIKTRYRQTCEDFIGDEINRILLAGWWLATSFWNKKTQLHPTTQQTLLERHEAVYFM